MRKELWNASTGTSNGPWPIRFELPNDINVKEYGVERQRFKLPPSFSVKVRWSYSTCGWCGFAKNESRGSPRL